MIVLHPHIDGHEHWLMVAEKDAVGGPCPATFRDICAIFVPNDDATEANRTAILNRARMLGERMDRVFLFPVSAERYEDEKASGLGDAEAAERVHHFYEEGGEDRLALATGGNG